jgi:hypothetical protein
MHTVYRAFTCTQIAVLTAAVCAQPAFAGDAPEVKTGALIFAHYGVDLSEQPMDDYAEGDPRPNEFDIDRVYLDFKTKIDTTFSARITTDVGRTNDKKLELFLKYAYLQVRASDDIKLRLGSAGTPMVGFSDNFWGQRWLAKSFTDQEKLLSSADIGIHALGSHADGLFGWSAAVINGAGYGNPEADTAKAAQMRLTVDPLHGDIELPISVFASRDVYTHEDVDPTTTLVASVGFSHEYANVWGEYVTDTTGELGGTGMSTNVVAKVQDLFNVVARYDIWDPDQDTKADAHATIRAGLTKDLAKKISAGMMVEQTREESDMDNPSKGFFLRMQAGY